MIQFFVVVRAMLYTSRLCLRLTCFFRYSIVFVSGKSANDPEVYL